MAAFSSAGQVRRRPAPVNTSRRRARSGLCISSEIDMCRSSQPAPNVTPHAWLRKALPRRCLRMILAGTIVVMASVAAMAAVFATGVMHPTALYGPMFFIGAGNGLVLPSGIAGAVSVRPDLAGAAAGLAGSLQIGFGALVAPFVGATLDTTVWQRGAGIRGAAALAPTPAQILAPTPAQILA